MSGSARKSPAELDLPLGQIRLWLKLLKGLLVFERNDNDRIGRIDMGLRKSGMKDRPHPLKLPRHMPRLLLARIGEDEKMRTANRDPAVPTLLGENSGGGEQKGEWENPLPHMGAG